MEEIVMFLNSILESLKIKSINNITIEQARIIIKNLNEFLYTNYEGIGETIESNKKMEYFSEYHRFWKQNYSEILNPQINTKKCEEVTEVFHDIYLKNKNAFYELYGKEELSDEEICKIRFYTASQDFYGSMKFSDYAEIYKKDATIFDKENIDKDPEGFAKNIGISTNSQTDKRIKYAQNQAKMLIELECEPYELFEKCNNDLIKVKNLLINEYKGMGFGDKKADMFIRDMIVLKIWTDCKNFEEIDVASDINTIKVALRTGILQTEIPLVSSFLDIFSYQYGLIDPWTRKAWREVWDIWKNKYPNECVEGPALMDYFIYRIIGKEFCKEKLAIYKCRECGHDFKWYSTRKQKCIICGNKNIELVKKVYPCQDSDGNIYIENNQYVSGDKAVLKGYKACPFKDVCNPTSERFIKYNGPNSISLVGKTGWETAYIRKNEGGGGLRS